MAMYLSDLLKDQKYKGIPVPDKERMISAVDRIPLLWRTESYSRQKKDLVYEFYVETVKRCFDLYLEVYKNG